MSDVDKLLALFTRRDVFNDDKFPNTCNRVRYFKDNEEGVSTMCKAVEEYGDRRAKAAEKLGKELGKKDALLTIAHNMKKENTSIEFIMKVTGLSKDEIEKM